MLVRSNAHVYESYLQGIQKHRWPESEAAGLGGSRLTEPADSGPPREPPVSTQRKEKNRGRMRYVCKAGVWVAWGGG